MNLKDKYTHVRHELMALREEDHLSSYQTIAPLIDLTLLDNHATPRDINALVSNANQHHVAAVCILPEHLNYLTPSCGVNLTTVINFPSGNESQQQVLNTIERITALHHINEIDYVFPYQAYLAGQKIGALTHCHHVYSRCKEHGLTFKVIIETGALPSIEVIYELSSAILKNGCDFLKTSTGKIANGATIPAAFSILSAIIDSAKTCGIKVSGGIKTIDQALTFLQLAEYMFKHSLNNTHFRIGASSLLDELIKKM